MIVCNQDGIIVKFDEKVGVLKSIFDGVREYVGEEIPVFEIGIMDKEGLQKRFSANDFTCTDAKIGENEFTCTYIGDFGMQIVISMKIEEEIKWSISSKVSSEYVTEWIQFPQIAVPHDLKDNGGEGKILWGLNEGALIEDLSEREKNLPYIEPGYPHISMMGIYPAIVGMQFMAYYNAESGLYFASHDKDDHLKGIDFYRYNGAIKLQFRHFCGTDFGCDYKMKYPMVMQFFKGDWYEAADIYRTWFKKEKASGYIPISENRNLPDWYRESPVVIAYPVRGVHDTDDMKPNRLYPYMDAMPHIERLEKELGSRVMVLLMHWEGTAPWSPPRVWPPFGGEEELKKFVDALHERGDVIGLYCSGLGWTYQSKTIPSYNTKQEFEEKNLKDVMCLSPKQELPFCKICEPQRAGYDMCPTHPFVLETLTKEIDGMVSAGVDYIQLMDQNHGGTSHFCYSRKHSHAPVPGKWQVDAMKKLYSQLFEKTGKVLFGCESAAAESYIPNLLFSDNRFNINYFIGVPVPAYAYVFHEYVNNFMGNQVCADCVFDNEKSPENLPMRIAYSFAAGDLITAVLNQNGMIMWNWGRFGSEEKGRATNQESVKKLIFNLNSWRRGEGQKYLSTGKMVKPIDVRCGENKIMCNTVSEKIFDKIFTSAWENDGFGQFLVNYNEYECECEIDLPEGTWKYIDLDKAVDIQSGKIKITVPALSAVLIEKQI